MQQYEWALCKLGKRDKKTHIDLLIQGHTYPSRCKKGEKVGGYGWTKMRAPEDGRVIGMRRKEEIEEGKRVRYAYFSQRTMDHPNHSGLIEGGEEGGRENGFASNKPNSITLLILVLGKTLSNVFPGEKISGTDGFGDPMYGAGKDQGNRIFQGDPMALTDEERVGGSVRC